MSAKSSIRQRLRDVLEDPTSRVGRAFELFIQALIVVSLVTFSVETLPDLEPQTRVVLRWLEVVIVTIFTLEYVARLWVTEDRPGFVFSFYGLIDLAAILPFYLTMGVDLRSVRILRLLRLLRMLKLFRYGRALDRFHLIWVKIRTEMTLVLIASVAIVYLSAVGIYFFENEAQPEQFSSVFSSMWWAIATLTTVGYGDVYPVTVGGRVFTTAILFVGLGIIAIPSGLIASALTEVMNEEHDAPDAPSPEAQPAGAQPAGAQPAGAQPARAQPAGASGEDADTDVTA